MLALLTDSFQLGAPNPQLGPVCGNDTVVKARLCTPPEIAQYYKVRASPQALVSFLAYSFKSAAMTPWSTRACACRPRSPSTTG